MTLTEEGTQSSLSLHKAVFLKDGKQLEQLLESKEHDINEKDKFGK